MEFGEVKNKTEFLAELKKRLDLHLSSSEYKNKSSLSKATGLSESYVSGIFRSKKIPSISTLYKITSAFGINIFEVTEGLERYLRPPGFQFNDKDSNLADKYKDKVLSEISLIKIHNEEPKELQNIHKFNMIDRSMNSFGYKKGSSIAWKELDSEPKQGQVYVYKSNKTQSLYLRRFWFQDNKVLLIPCTDNLDYEILLYDIDEIEILGEPIFVVTNIK